MTLFYSISYYVFILLISVWFSLTVYQFLIDRKRRKDRKLKLSRFLSPGLGIYESWHVEECEGAVLDSAVVEIVDSEMKNVASYAWRRYADLLAAAPVLARALCSVEWRGQGADRAGPVETCVCCEGIRGSLEGDGHKKNCELNAALDGAGIHSETRENVRKSLCIQVA